MGLPNPCLKWGCQCRVLAGSRAAITSRECGMLVSLGFIESWWSKKIMTGCRFARQRFDYGVKCKG